MPEPVSVRRGFLQGLFGLGGASAAFAAAAPRPAAPSPDPRLLPRYARVMEHRSLKQSSHDRTGGNADYWPVAAGATREVFAADGPGVVTHIWITIAAPSVFHLKEIVLRMYWDGNARPSVEVPVGDFFGLNLGQYSVYESGFLNCSPVKALNSYFAMPFRKSARFTVTNEGAENVGAFYSNIDYQLVPSLPEDALYFHAQYRQSAPPVASSNDWKENGDANKLQNPDGKANHVFFETRGRGHLMGVTLGVIQNQELWMGEGDDMIYIDDETKPAIVGTGSEDYFCGAWDFGGRDGSIPFAHLWNGAHLIQSAERAGGRYCLYRWHADNPVTFTRYLKHTIEHGHANHRADSFYSVGYWYQSEPHTDFPVLPALAERLPGLKAVGGPGGAKPS
jgi:D-arabinan exo alpha-(1,3)/(1,5)-arabinofuranosidase (non-reducing end)